MIITLKKPILILLSLFVCISLCSQSKFSVNREKIDQMLQQQKVSSTPPSSKATNTSSTSASAKSQAQKTSTTSKPRSTAAPSSSSNSEQSNNTISSSEEERILSMTFDPAVKNQNQAVGNNTTITGVVVGSKYVYIQFNFKEPSNIIGPWVSLSSKTILKVGNSSTRYKIVEWGYVDKDNELISLNFDEHYDVKAGGEYNFYMLFEAPNFAFNQISVYENGYTDWYWENIQLNPYGSYVEEDNTPVVRKFYATGLSYKNIDKNGKETEWSDWEEVNFLIVYKSKERTIEIYSKDTQEFDIVQYNEDESDGYGGVVSPMVCVDNNGERCVIRYREAKDKTLQLYIEYNNFKYVYTMVEK